MSESYPGMEDHDAGRCGLLCPYCEADRLREWSAKVQAAWWRSNRRVQRQRDEARGQRDRLAEAMEALNAAARSAIFPESVRRVIRGEDWRRLWECIYGADAALADLEKER